MHQTPLKLEKRLVQLIRMDGSTRQTWVKTEMHSQNVIWMFSWIIQVSHSMEVTRRWGYFPITWESTLDVSITCDSNVMIDIIDQRRRFWGYIFIVIKLYIFVHTGYVLASTNFGAGGMLSGHRSPTHVLCSRLCPFGSMHVSCSRGTTVDRNCNNAVCECI